MPKLLRTVVIIAVLLFLFSFSCSAQELDDLKNQIDSLYNSLSYDVQNDLKAINVDYLSPMGLKDISFEDILNLVFAKTSEQSTGVLASSAVVIAILLLNALLDSYTDTLKNAQMKEVLSVVSTLCITSTLVLPVIDLISDCIATITDASNFMLLYIPVMVAILAFSGHAVTGSTYYSFMVLACQGVSQLSSKFISPLLNVYLGFCVSSSISERVNLTGFCQMFSKIIKWLIAFVMTVFSALMTIRGMITTAYDSVTARAVRFTMSSFIPIVGAALSESYKTIQGSINLLRAGAGVFVILAIAVVFLPVIIRCLLWMLSVNFCKSIGEVIGIKSQLNMLSSVGAVISTVFAITVCIMSMFIISTALLITLGGGAQ